MRWSLSKRQFGDATQKGNRSGFFIHDPQGCFWGRVRMGLLHSRERDVAVSNAPSREGVGELLE